MITKVTITGADDSIKPEQLIYFTHKYPFVEWGILVSRDNYGTARFPSTKWMSELCRLNLPISLHLCGRYVRDFLKGDYYFTDEIDFILNAAKRVQINTHSINHSVYGENINEYLSFNQDKEFIFQYDNVNTYLLCYLLGKKARNFSTLFDLSGGKGVLPSHWPKPIEGIKCGYAGGISPDNIDNQINKIESIVGLTNIWIDMETHVRSNNDQLFDLTKVDKCLKISSNYIQLGF